ncbi:MAG: ankyrin repeat domain-containing protein [Burkholderiales bacterium]|nr:ankyrin repeat domain-containing protein [Phycisphaerae bacterium]
MSVAKPCVESLESRRMLADVLGAVVDAGKPLQTINAIGGAAAAWQQAEEYRSAAYYDRLAGDLGATIVRAGLWPSFEIVNDNNDPNVIDWTKFDDRAIASTMEFFKQMKARGVDQFLLTVWSPPGWMKTNNSASHGTSIRPYLREEFAEYVSAAIQRAKSRWGIDITEVSLSNEPWFVEHFQTASHTPVQLREEIKTVAARLKQDGLTTRLIAPEDVSSLNRTLNYVSAIEKDPAALDAVAAWGSHYLNPQQMGQLKARVSPLGKEIWYTEVGNGSTDITGAMGLARGADNIFTNGGANTYINWLFSNMPGISSFESLMNGPTPNKKFYALKHFARFVRPGAKLLTSTYVGDTVRVTSFKHSESGALSVVLSNSLATAIDVQITLKGTAIPASFRQFRTSATEDCAELPAIAGAEISGAGTMTVSLPPGSIVTLYAGPDFAAMPVVAPPPSAPVAQPYEGWNTDAVRRAAMTGEFETLKALIDAGADPDLSLGDGWTPLFFAAASPYYSTPQIITRLLNAGVDKQRRNSEGMSALHVAAMNPMTRFAVPEAYPTDRVKLLLAAGLDPNARDGYARTPLHYAAMLPKVTGDMQQTSFDTSLLKALLDAGADPNAVDASGKTPLNYANAEGFGPGATLLKQKMGQNVASLAGKFFEDLNENGLLDDDEPGLADRIAYLDINKNAALDAGEPKQVASLYGDYQFLDLPAGTYVLRQVAPQGWSATTSAKTLTLISGENRAGVNLGTVHKAPPPPPPPGKGSIVARAYIDTNRNKARDAGEAVMANVTVYLDANDNGSFDSGESSRKTDIAGAATFGDVTAGSYRVRTIAPAGYQATQQPLTLVVVKSGAASDAIFGFAKLATPTGGQISGYIVNDKNKNGAWNSGEVGIAGRSVWLDLDNDGIRDANEPKVLTASNGKYLFTGLAAGNYKVRQIVPAGWKQIKPTNKAAFSVTLISGQIKSGFDFLTSLA